LKNGDHRVIDNLPDTLQAIMAEIEMCHPEKAGHQLSLLQIYYETIYNVLFNLDEDFETCPNLSSPENIDTLFKFSNYLLNQIAAKTYESKHGVSFFLEELLYFYVHPYMPMKLTAEAFELHQNIMQLAAKHITPPTRVNSSAATKEVFNYLHKSVVARYQDPSASAQVKICFIAKMVAFNRLWQVGTPTALTMGDAHSTTHRRTLDVAQQRITEASTTSTSVVPASGFGFGLR
jgi:hypothetical protein